MRLGRAEVLAMGVIAAAACNVNHGGTAPSPTAAHASGAAKALHALFDAEWEYRMKDRPVHASRIGDRRYNALWEDASPAAYEARHQHDQEVLTATGRISEAELSADDKLNLALFKKEYTEALELYPFHLELFPVQQRDGIQTLDELADDLPFTTTQDYEDWVGRLERFPAYVDQTILLMREGIRRRLVFPKIVMQRVTAQLDKQIVVRDEDSPFFVPLRKFAPNVPEVDRARLSGRGKKAVHDGVVPAFTKFRAFFVGEYLPACTDTVGLWALPDGEAMYATLARYHTTTSKTPREIHEIGLREVARIHAEMLLVMKKTGFTGTLPEFFTYLRTDPRFYEKTPEALFTAYAATAKRIDPHLVRLFKTLPRTPYGVEAIPAAVAPDTTTAYYRQPADDGSRAGTYFVNLYRPETRPTWEMMALTLHESVPGHHLQIALAMELPNMPAFRRHDAATAFVEGWGLYAESLGEEMGLYDDPYAKFGQLTYEMWRAVRLVVDTGLHAFKWERKQAIDYFMQNAPKQELDITNEIDRYIVMPGQALAYKIGELKIKELRARAERELGPAFHERDFHDAVLLQGSLPLDLLEERITRYIQMHVRREL